MQLPASKTRIDKAGEAIRRHALGDPYPEDEYREHLRIVREFRACHSYPLTNVAMGLRHHARKAAGGSWLDLSQRLKQLGTIQDKLTRLPKSNLARMQDIGGCRATFVDQATVDRAIASIQKRHSAGSWDIAALVDYVDDIQRRDGYRAKHMIVRKHGLRIEIQFRTLAQHDWAQLMEELDKRKGLGLKSGTAPAWALDAVAAAASDMRQYERGEIPRQDLVKRLNTSLEPILTSADTRTTIT